MDLMQRRRQLMCMQSELPSAYRRVGYIESSERDNTHINTGVLLSENIVFEIDFQIVSTIQRSKYFMGQYSGTTFFMYVAGSNENPLLQTSFGTNWQTTDISLDQNRHIYRYWIENGEMKLSDNGSIGFSKSFSELSDKPLLVAGSWRGNQLSCRTYRSTINKNGVVVQNLIPCVRKSDNKPGMYDTVSKTFYTNAGAGEFIVPV